MEEMRNAYIILVGKPGRKRPCRHRCRQEDYIRMCLVEIVWKGVDWIHVAQDMDQ
jgi:hypothetical protein